MMAAGLGGGAAAGSTSVRASAPETNASQRHSRGGGDQHGSFAGLLAGSGPPDGVASGSGVESTSAPPAGEDHESTEEGGAEDLPDQILNLLGGNAWSPVTPHGGDSHVTVEATGTPSTASIPGTTRSIDGSGAALPAGGVATPGGPSTAGNGAGVSPATDGTALPMAPVDIADGPDSSGELPVTAGAANEVVATTPSLGPEGAGAVEFVLPGQTPTINGPARSGAPPLPGAPMAMPAEPEAGFDDSFGARIGWMAEQRVGHAQLRVSPDHLGPIDVRLQLDGTRVTAEFVSASAEVRQSLEASVGRLRDLLDQQGLQLAHTDVGGGQSGGSGQRKVADPDARPDSFDEPGTTGVMAASPQIRRGLLDEYA